MQSTVIDKGKDMAAVKETLQRWNVIEDMKMSLMEQEDALIRDISMEPDKMATMQLRIAMTRNNLNDLMDTIEGFILDGENEIAFMEEQERTVRKMRDKAKYSQGE